MPEATSDLFRTVIGKRVYDLEQPRTAGMPVHPNHRPGYAYFLYRRHRDAYAPKQRGHGDKPEDRPAVSAAPSPAQLAGDRAATDSSPHESSYFSP